MYILFSFGAQWPKNCLKKLLLSPRASKYSLPRRGEIWRFTVHPHHFLLAKPNAKRVAYPHESTSTHADTIVRKTRIRASDKQRETTSSSSKRKSVSRPLFISYNQIKQYIPRNSCQITHIRLSSSNFRRFPRAPSIRRVSSHPRTKQKKRRTHPCARALALLSLAG